MITAVAGLAIIFIGFLILISQDRYSPGAILVLVGAVLVIVSSTVGPIVIGPTVPANLSTEAQVVDSVAELYQRAHIAELKTMELEQDKAEVLAEKEKLEARVKFLEEATRPPPERMRGSEWFLWFVGIITGYWGAPAIKATWDALKLRAKARLNR